MKLSDQHNDNKVNTLGFRNNKIDSNPLNVFNKLPNLMKNKIVIKTLKRNGIDVNSIDELFEQLYLNDLTKLFNRRYYNQIISKEIMNSEKLGNIIYIAYLDGDNIKYINDTYSHIDGDEQIRFLSNTISKEIESCPIVHVSGDEFMIISLGQPYETLVKQILSVKESISKEAFTRKMKNYQNYYNNKILIPPPISFTCIILNKRVDETLSNTEYRLQQRLNEIKSHDKGSVYLEDKKVWGYDVNDYLKDNYLSQAISQNIGIDNYFIILKFEFFEDANDRTNKINSHIINSVRQVNMHIKERFTKCVDTYRLDDSKSVLIFRDVDISKTNDNDLSYVINEINNIIINQPELKNNVGFYLGGQAILKDYSAEQIINSAEQKLKKAKDTNSNIVIGRRLNE